MPGATTQLAFSSSQDEWLHGKKSFFYPRTVRYLNYAAESILVTPNGCAGFNQRTRFEIPIHGEYIKGGYIEILLAALDAPADGTPSGYVYHVQWIHKLGIYILEKLEFEVNGTIHDEHEAEWVDMWTRLTCPESKRKGFNDLIGEVNLYNRYGNGNSAYVGQIDTRSPQVGKSTQPQLRMMIPLHFWWCQTLSQALPIGSMIFCKSVINVFLRRASDLYIVWESPSAGFAAATDIARSTTDVPTTPTVTSMNIYLDYVFLTKRGRNLFNKSKKIYVIRHVKNKRIASVTTSPYTHELNQVMPQVAIYWGIRETAATAHKNYHIWDRYTDNQGSPNTAATLYNLPDTVISRAKITLLSENRITERDAMYFNRIQPYVHHTTIPETKGIYMYSFAEYPEEFSMPSGDCNMSSADHSSIVLTMNQTDGVNGTGSQGIGLSSQTGTLYVYGLAYNYFFIKAGYGALIFNA